jgi:hypothetical protein
MAMSDALAHLSSAIQGLSTDLLCAQVEIATGLLMLHESPSVAPELFNYGRANLEVLLAECERRGLSSREAIGKGRDAMRRWEETIAWANEPAKPKVQ